MAGLENFNETIFELLQKKKQNAQFFNDINTLNQINKFNFTGIPENGETAEDFLQFFKADTEGQNDIKNLQKLSSYGLANKLPEDLLKSINEKINAFLTGQGTLQYGGQQLTKEKFANSFITPEEQRTPSDSYEQIIEQHTELLAKHDRSIDGLYKLFFKKPLTPEERILQKEDTTNLIVRQTTELTTLSDNSKLQELKNIENNLKNINKNINRRHVSRNNNDSFLRGLKKYIVGGALIKDAWPLAKRAIASSYDVQLAGDTLGYVKGIGKGILSPYTTYNDIIQERTTLAKNKEDFALTGTDNNYKWLSMVGATAYDNPDEIKRKADVFIKSQGISDLGGQALYEHLGIGETAKADNTSTGENLAQVIEYGIELGLGALGIRELFRAMRSFGGGAKGGVVKTGSVLKSVTSIAKKIIPAALGFVAKRGPLAALGPIGAVVGAGTIAYEVYQHFKTPDNTANEKLKYNTLNNNTTQTTNTDNNESTQQNNNLTINIDTPFRELNDLIEREANNIINEYGLAR